MTTATGTQYGRGVAGNRGVSRPPALIKEKKVDHSPLVVALVSATALTITALTGCSTPPPPVDVSSACAEVTKTSPTPTCTKLFDTGTALRLPTPQEGVIGAISRGGKNFLTSDGTSLELPDEILGEVTKDSAYATTVYQAETDGKKVTRVAPALTIPEDVVLTRIFGSTTMSGKISPYLGDDTYDQTASLPVVLTLVPAAADGKITGSIANATTPVALSDGTCAPALAATGTRNPLRGTFGGTISIERVPSMHTAFDDELVLAWDPSSSGMGDGFYPSVATLMGHDPLTGSWTVIQHGTPISGPLLELHLTSGAAGSAATCT